MLKLSIATISGLMVYGVWFWKRVNARRRLEDFDAGRRCLSCEGTEVEVREGRVHCRACGHVASLAELNRVKLSSREIADMTRPDGSSRM